MKNIANAAMTVRHGMIVFGEWLWNLLLTPSPFAPVMLFYHVAPILIVYLYMTNPGAQVGLNNIAELTRLPWWFPPALFIVCAMVGYENRTPKVNALLTLPMAFYAVVLLVASLERGFSSTSLLTALYMVVAAWAALSLTRYYQELQTVKLALIFLQRTMDVNEAKKGITASEQRPTT